MYYQYLQSNGPLGHAFNVDVCCDTKISMRSQFHDKFMINSCINHPNVRRILQTHGIRFLPTLGSGSLKGGFQFGILSSWKNNAVFDRLSTASVFLTSTAEFPNLLSREPPGGRGKVIIAGAVTTPLGKDKSVSRHHGGSSQYNGISDQPQSGQRALIQKGDRALGAEPESVSESPRCRRRWLAQL